MAMQTAMKVEENPESISNAKLQSLACSQCGYALAGLVLDRASVKCPECSFEQPLMVWNRVARGKIDQNHPLMGCFAIIGLVVMGLFFLLVLSAVVSALI